MKHWIVLSSISLLAGLGLYFPVGADEIKFGGVVIEGTVTNVNADGVELDTKYGKLTIPFDEIEGVTTEEPLYVIHGEDGETSGKILGVEDGQLLVGDDPLTAERIDVTTIRETETAEAMEGFAGQLERFRYRFRYWTASLNAGLVYSDKTVDELNFNISADIDRRKAPTRLAASVSYLYGQQRSGTDGTRKTDNELFAAVKGELDMTERLFLVTTHTFENDEIDRISFRWVGVGGLGYRVLNGDNHRFQGEVGGSYVYRRFHGGSTEEYPAISFAIEGFHKLPYFGTLTYTGSYVPSLQKWRQDYLLVGQATFTFPVYAGLAFKTILRDTYDSTLQRGVQKNEFRTILALSWVF